MNQFAQTRANCLSLARRMRNQAHTYRAWAREAQQIGAVARAERHEREADRCWRVAKRHIQFAHQIPEGMPC